MLLIYCPISPSSSASSGFLGRFLQECAPLLLDHDVRIVVDGSAFAGQCPSFHLGFPVIDFRFWTPPIDAHVTHLIFVTTHKLHRYCYSALKMPKLGPTIAIAYDLDYKLGSFTQKELDSFHHSSLKRIAQTALRAQILGLSSADEVWVTDRITADLINSVPTHVVQNIAQSMESLLERINGYIKNDEPDFRLAHHTH
jgi:hypothetical protein